MKRSTSHDEVRVGLAYVGLSRSVVTVLEHLAFARLKATFFVPPHQLVSDPVRWRRVLADGHELGNSALLGVTDDGRLKNWDFEAIRGDLHDTDKLLKELGSKAIDSIYLPGHYHLCSEGRYRRLVQKLYSVCLSDANQAAALDGRPGQFDMVPPGHRARLVSTSVVVTKGEVEAGAHSRMMLRISKYNAGPVRDLSTLSD